MVLVLVSVLIATLTACEPAETSSSKIDELEVSVIETEPTKESSTETISETPAETKTVEIIPITFKDKDMPAPYAGFSEGKGGDGMMPFINPFTMKVNAISSNFEKIVGYNKSQTWANICWEIVRTNPQYFEIINSENIKKYINLYGFFNHFNVSKEDAIEAFEKENEFYNSDDYNDGETPFTQEEIDLLFSDDLNKVLEYFCYENAFYSDGTIYTEQWIYGNPISEYKRIGLTPEIMLEKIEAFKKNRINFSDEGKVAFEKKLSEYTGQEVVLY